jgi:hypothetical protein
MWVARRHPWEDTVKFASRSFLFAHLSFRPTWGMLVVQMAVWPGPDGRDKAKE